MMYKKVIIILLTLTLALGIVHIKAKAKEPELQKNEILIVYNNNPTKEEINGIQIVVKMLTYLQYSTVFITIEESASFVDIYDKIICYSLSGDLSPFIKQLAKHDHKVFFIGSGGVEEYIRQKEYPLKVRIFPSSVPTISYGFSESNEFVSLNSKEEIVLLEGDFTYLKGKVFIRGEETSLYSGYEEFLYLPFSDLSTELLRASFTKEIAQWLWPYDGEPHSYAQYYVLNEIYPFTPPEKLLEIVDYLINNELPYVISVMPIYQNGEYPAMKSFCDVLRYAQANGGAIIMHNPTVINDKENVTRIQEYMTYGTEAYTNLGVYPLGIEVPESYMFSETSRTLLKRYSTIFFYKDMEETAINLDEQYNIIYKDGHKMVGPAIQLVQTHGSMTKVHASAIYLDINEGFHQIKEKIDAGLRSNIPLKSLWDTDCTVYADNLYYYTKQGQLFLNDKYMDLTYVPAEIDEDFDYQSTVFKWITNDLNGLNRKLIIFVLVACFVFISFIIRARVSNRNKFLLPREGEEKK